MTSSVLVRAEWERIAPLPEPNGGFMAGPIGDRIVVLGGTNWRDETKRWLDTVWVFEPASGKWTAAGRLPHPLAYAACTGDGQQLYLAGGADGERGRREIYRVDEQLRIRRVAELSEPVVYAGAFLRGSRLLLVGGTPDPDDWGQVTSAVRAVDLATGESSVIARLPGLPAGVGIPAVASAGGRTIAVGGGWLKRADMQVHNVANAFLCEGTGDTWQPRSAYPRTVRGLAAVSLDERRIYVAGGYGTNPDEFLATGYLYDTLSDRFSPAMPVPLASLTSLVACQDHIYALAGEDRAKHRSDACWRIRISELLSSD
ncbi:MAG: Kelch repeat-containing protein [Pirellulaceae bacterium]